MKRKVILPIFAVFILLISFVYAEPKDGEYDVKVCLLKKYEDDFSMGNNAMLPDATLRVKDGKGILRLSFVSLKTQGFEGYLGELYIDGKKAKVISEYDFVDIYNDPDDGIDEIMKGKKYPEFMEVPIDINQDIIPCSVYVPVMGELTDGHQDARIQITYPKGFADGTAEPKPIEEYYRVPVQLWHAFEDKESMGNKSMKGEANLLIEDGKMTLYLGSDKMEVSGIIASMINMYYDDGNKYVKATPYAFDMKVEGDESLRPEVFSMPLNNKDEFLNLMVDPKVEPMGDDPIKARLKIDFENMKRIDKSEAELVLKSENGSPKQLYDAGKEYTKIDKGIQMIAKSGTFDKDYTFYANAIRGEKLNEIKDNFDALAIVEAFDLSSLGAMESIPYDVKSPINSIRESYQPKKTVKVKIPMAENIIDLKLYAMEEKMKELEYQMEDNYVVFDADKFVPFAMVYKKDMTKANATVASVDDSDNDADKNKEKDEIKELMLNGQKSNSLKQNVNFPKKRERYGFIWIFSIIMIALLIAGIYFIRKYYVILSRELQYAKELEIQLNQRKGVNK